MENSPQSIAASQDLSGEASRQRRKRWLGILQVAISIGLLVWLLSRVGLRDVTSVFANLNPWLYALAGLVFLVSIGIRSVRWYVLLTPLGVYTSILDLFWLYLLGFFWNNFLPTGFGGDVVKAIALRKATGRGGASVTSVLAERIIGLLATSLVAIMVILSSPKLFPPEAIYVVVGVCAAIIIGIWAVQLGLLTWLGKHLPFLQPVVGHRWIISIQESLQAYDLKVLVLGLLTSMPFTLCLILDNYLVGIALGVKLPISYFAIYTPIVSIVSLLPLSFNGLGVREYAYQVLFGMVGVSPEQAIAMSLAFNFLRFGAGMLGGLASLAGGMQRLVTDKRVNGNE